MRFNAGFQEIRVIYDDLDIIFLNKFINFFYKQLRKLDGTFGTSYTKRRNKLKDVVNIYIASIKY